MAQLPVPQIKTSIGDPGQYMQAAATNIAGVRQAVGDIVDRYNYEEKMALATKEREDRLAQQAIDNKRAEAMLKMQQNQEQRAIDALAKTDATQQAVVNYANTLSNYGKDVITAEQGDKLAALYAKNPKAVEAEVAKMQNAYNNGLQARRAMLDSITMPTTYNEVVVDPKAMLDVKTRVLDNVDDQIKTKQKQDFEMAQDDKRIASQNAIANSNRAAQIQLAKLQISANENRYNKELEREIYKMKHSPENIKTNELAIKLANTEFNNLDTKTKKMYGNDIKNYYTSNYDRLTQSAREDVLNPKAKDFSMWTSTVGNPDDVADFIAKARAIGKTDTEIQRALSSSPKGSSIFDIGLPELDVEYARKLLNKN